MTPRPAKGSAVLTREDLTDIYLDLRPRIERVIARRTGSLTLAGDLAQEMFFKIGAIRVSLATRADAERYLLRVAANAALDHVRIEGRRRAILEDAGKTEPLANPLSPERSLLASDQLRRVEDALRELPEKCRAVFTMSRFNGLSHAEIAARLGVSQSLVEKYVVRALLHCRSRLSD